MIQRIREDLGYLIVPDLGEVLDLADVIRAHLDDGMTVFRRGSELTTRLHARRFVAAVRPDVVVEEINTLPYFTPFWSPVPSVLYINQLAREVWWYEAPLPLAILATHADALRSLRGLAFDTAFDDEFAHIPLATKTFSDSLEALEVPHVYEVYEGDHRNRMRERLATKILPWIDARLKR